MLILLPGCSRNEEALFGRAIPVKPSQVLSGRPLNGRMFIIGISLPPQNAYFRAMRAGMDAAAADNEVLLDVQFAGAIGDQQRRQAPELIERRVNALLIWSTDANLGADTVQAATTVNVPVFTIGFPARRGGVTTHFVTDAPFAGLSPEQIGKTVVDRIAAYLRGEKLSPQIVIRPE